VGAQTRIISQKNPKAKFVSIDLSEKSLSRAAETVRSLNIGNVEFQQADVFELPYKDNDFDHVFVCFLLEHLAEPRRALLELRRVLKAGGTITVIEGDHGSTYFFPDSLEAQKAVQAQVMLQKHNGGNANIGRQLYPMLADAGFINVKASPRVVFVDDSRPDLAEGFTRNTFTAMIKGIGDEAISKGVISKEEFERGIKDLYRSSEGGGTFCYTFFKVIGFKPH
jgi:SAM-dependent methyltransferase